MMAERRMYKRNKIYIINCNINAGCWSLQKSGKSHDWQVVMDWWFLKAGGFPFLGSIRKSIHTVSQSVVNMYIHT